MSIRVFLLDDHELVREGIRSLLESDEGIKIVGEAGTAEEAMTRIPLAQPDVAILDVRLEDESGIEVCRDVRALMPGLVCLMLTSFADDEALFASIMAGAAGYVLKQIKARDLLDILNQVPGFNLFEHVASGSGHDAGKKSLVIRETGQHQADQPRHERTDITTDRNAASIL